MLDNSLNYSQNDIFCIFSLSKKASDFQQVGHKCRNQNTNAYPEFILCTPLQALYSTAQVFSSVLWMKVCSLWEVQCLILSGCIRIGIIIEFMDAINADF